MTSSKSFRASIMPSMLRSNTDPDSPSTRKSVKKSNPGDLSQLRGANIGSSKSTTNLPHPGQQDADAVPLPQNDRPRSAEQKTLRKRNDSAPKVSLPKSQSTTSLSPVKGSNRMSRFWGNRLSSFLPSLVVPSESSTASPTTSKSAPTPAAPSAPATAASGSPAPTKSSSPTDTSTTTNTAGTPPTTVDDSDSSTTPSVIEPTLRMNNDYHDALAYQGNGQYQPHQAGSPPSPDSIPTRGSDSLDGQLSPNPQIMAPIPPSPEVQRATMSPQEPSMPPPPIPNPSSDVSSSGTRKLRKENPATRSRSGSLQHTSSGSNGDSIQALKTRTTSPMPDRGRRASSVQSPNNRDTNTKSRVVSTPLAIRPSSSKGDVSQSPTRGRIRRSWLPGGRSRSNSIDVSNANTSTAWVLSDETQAEYNASFLKNGEKVPELWNESGAVLVYLFPKSSGCGPSFKVQEFTISSSWVFNELIQREREPMGRDRTRSFSGRHSLTAEDANRYISSPTSPPIPDDGTDDCLHLYLPTGAPGQDTQPDMERLIAMRNLFAFLTGQPLVATKARPSNFHAFLEVSGLLEEYGFSSYDGTTFGDAVDLSFGFYMDQHALADCRHSREKTIEALILGERMRSADLYNEAFAHAAGKYAAIQELKLPLFDQISQKTRVSLERAHLDLLNRQHSANMHLEQFDFPALFSGIANSTSMMELRSVRFKVWRQSFTKMRNFALGYYKTTFGNWPPKASSKKNPFSESGLNRLVLKVLYSDMCALYDLLVDRTNRTSRIMDEVPALSDDPDMMILSALRNIMSEFDRSKPPVLPPIPYDCPQLPSATSILETYDTLSPKKQAKFDKNIKEHELMLMLNKGYNYDTNATKVPFLDKFKEFELREARGKNPQDFADQRVGYWLFLYVVIQSLPVLVVDAPGMQFTEGVEYFLCEPPLGNPPWVPDQQVKKMWYEVAGGGGLVELSQDAVLFSVEATYHRSHCWLAATQWETGGLGISAQATTEPSLSPLQPPRSMFLDNDDFMPTPPPSFGNGYNTPPSPIGSPSGSLRPRTHSPGGNRANQAWRSSIALGLEPVPLQPPSPFGERSSSLGGRPPSLMMGSRNSSMGNLAALGHAGYPQTESPPPEMTGATFDDILRSDAKKKEKKKSRFF
ncbi:hypothetical protein ACHAO9_000246 [Fusarium lateritium]